MKRDRMLDEKSDRYLFIENEIILPRRHNRIVRFLGFTGSLLRFVPYYSLLNFSPTFWRWSNSIEKTCIFNYLNSISEIKKGQFNFVIINLMYESSFHGVREEFRLCKINGISF